MKNRRHQVIMHVIQTRNVRSQEELQSILKGRGLDVTQATISRDIKDLGLVKTRFKGTNGRTSSKYVLQADGMQQASRLHRFVSELVESIAGADNFIVLKTPPRCALMVGSELDKAAWPEILGTISGDDTILCICASKALAGRAISQLKTIKQRSGAAR